jgi:uncharacterized protein YyaL (SSP411 family)
MSATYDANAAFYTDENLPVSLPGEREELGTCAAAMQLFMTACETTGRRTYLTRASIVVDFAERNGAVASASGAERAAYADALLRLEQFSGNGEYGQTARQILQLERTGTTPLFNTARLALAVTHAAQFPLHIVVLGGVEKDENAAALWATALKQAASARAIELLDPERNAGRIQELGYMPSAASALAYICIGPMCLAPVSSPDAFNKAMSRARSG